MSRMAGGHRRYSNFLEEFSRTVLYSQLFVVLILVGNLGAFILSNCMRVYEALINFLHYFLVEVSQVSEGIGLRPESVSC